MAMPPIGTYGYIFSQSGIHRAKVIAHYDDELDMLQVERENWPFNPMSVSCSQFYRTAQVALAELSNTIQFWKDEKDRFIADCTERGVL